MVRKLEADLGWRCDETHRQQHTEVLGAEVLYGSMLA